MSSASELARQHTADAIRTLTGVMNDPLEKASDRIAAARDILDRGHGKPLNTTIAIPADKQQRRLIEAMTDSELMEAIRNSPLPRLRHEAEDAELVSGGDPLLD